MKRKIFSLLLTASMIATCFSGCGNSSEESKTSESSKSTSTAVTEKTVNESTSQEEAVELEEKTIQLWLMGPGKQKDSDEVWEAFNEMLKEYVPNTTVEFTIIPAGEYNDKFSQLLSAGEKVDLAWVGYASGDLNQHIRDGNLMALDSLAEEYGQGILETLGTDVLDMNRANDGQLYYLISWQGLISNMRTFYVPTELADLAGEGWLEETREAVTKWWNTDFTVENFQAVFDQFGKYLNAAKEAGKLYSGVDTNTFMGWNYAGTYINTASVGPVRNDDSFKVVDGVQSEVFRTFAKNMADYYTKGYIRSDIASVTTGASGNLDFVKDGEYTNNTVILNISQTAEAEFEASAGVDVSAMPIEENGTLGKGTETAMAIPYCADEPERAMMVLNALYTEPELYQLLIYGFEGRHYTDNGDGTITTPYGANGTADADYGLRKWTIGTCMNALTTQVEKPGYYEEQKAAEASAIINPMINFSFDSSSVSEIVAALTAIDLEYADQIRKGYKGDQWEETLNKWIAERKDAGVDTLIEEYQRQIDEYIKANNITSW